MPSFAWLQADGSISSGNWFYCNSYTEKGNMSARRGQEDAVNKIGLYHEFAVASNSAFDISRVVALKRLIRPFTNLAARL